MFEFFFETGARCGEGLGLLWDNVDFGKKFIKIDHQLLYELDEQGRQGTGIIAQHHCTYPAAYCLHQNGRGRGGPEDVAGDYGAQ